MFKDTEKCDVCGQTWSIEDITHTNMGKGEDAVCPDCMLDDHEIHKEWLDSSDNKDDVEDDDLYY